MAQRRRRTPTAAANAGSDATDPTGARSASDEGRRAATAAPGVAHMAIADRPFLPSLDLVDASAVSLRGLSAEDKRQILAGKVADVTHFRVGLDSLRQHAAVARLMADDARPLPRHVRGVVVNPDESPALRVTVQPALPTSQGTIGRGVITDANGVFTLPLPEVSDEQRVLILEKGLGLRFTGKGNVAHTQVVPLPNAGSQVLGQIKLDQPLEPLPQSVVGALVDLVSDLPFVASGDAVATSLASPVKIQIGEGACNIQFQEDTAIRRFPYRILVRLIEPRTTTVNKVFFPGGPFFDPGRTVALPLWNNALLPALQLQRTLFVDRLPIDKPISVDGFRDQLIGLNGGTIGVERRVPMAGTLGLGYVLNLAQVWKYQGLTLGNLVYSLPLAPGEQQRIAVSERVATAFVSDTERLDIAEQQRSALRENTSAQATFDSAFEEHVNASSSYRNEARSSSWGVAGGIGAVLGPVALGIGAGGGGGKSSNNGNVTSALDGVRNYTSTASESMHRDVERQAAARRSAQRTSMRLATETDRETVTTKVITNHNKAHALTIQYWEVLRRFSATTEVEGVNLVCFIPLDVVRFLPPGQPLELTDLANVDTRAEALARYRLLHRHADAVQPNLPGVHREGLRLLTDFAANARALVDLSGPASDSLTFSLTGRYIPYERVWVHVLIRGGRRIGPVRLDSPLTVFAPNTFGTRAELLAELKRLRAEGAEVNMTGSLAVPEAIDPSEVVGFEIRRAFETLDVQLDPAKNPQYVALKGLEKFFNIDLSVFESAARLTPAELEREIGGPFVHDFSVILNSVGDSIAADRVKVAMELSPSGLPIPALEQQPILGFRELMKIERTLQHVVRNTLTYSKAVWSSLTPEERVVMLEGLTIGLPESGLDGDGLADPSQHVPLLNCVANQVLGYYGNCMIMPFSIPAALAVQLAGDADAGDATGKPLTTGSVQDALTQFHRQAFSPPISHFTLPTRGVLGEAVLGHCPAAEKIDLTRFWNWQDSPADEATAISNVALRSNTLAQLQAPSSLTGQPTIINNVAGEGGGGLVPGSLTQQLAGRAPQATDFSTDFLGQAALTALGGKTIDSAEAARKDALGSATQLAGKALDAGVDVFKTKLNADKAAEDKKNAQKKEEQEKEQKEKAAAATKQADAVKNLKENAASYLAAANNKPDVDLAREFALGIVTGLAGGALPPNLAAQLFAAYDQKKPNDPNDRTLGSKAWLAVLGLS